MLSTESEENVHTLVCTICSVGHWWSAKKAAASIDIITDDNENESDLPDGGGSSR